MSCGGNPPLGYNLDSNGKLIVNESEAEVVKLIFEYYEKGFSYQKIADHLNKHGYKTKLGGSFTKNSFISILRQEKYIGTYFWNRRSARNSLHKRNDSSHKPVAAQVLVNDEHEPIITKEQFERVQALLRSRAGGFACNATKHHYMLGGMKKLKCAECGRYMVGEMRTSHGRKYIVYSCPNHKIKDLSSVENNGVILKKCPTIEINGESLNNFVAQAILINIMPKSYINNINKAIAMYDVNKELYTKKKRIEKNIDNITEAIAQSGSSVLIEKLKTFEKKLEEINNEIENNKTPIRLNDENFSTVREKLVKHLTNSTDINVIDFLNEIIDTIIIGNDEVIVKLKIN